MGGNTASGISGSYFANKEPIKRRDERAAVMSPYRSERVFALGDMSAFQEEREMRARSLGSRVPNVMEEQRGACD